MKTIITDRIKSAILANNKIESSILRVLKGEIERLEQDPKKGKVEVPNDKIYNIIKQLIINSTPEEIAVLETLIPTQLTEQQIIELIDDMVEKEDLKANGIKSMKVILAFFNEEYAGCFDSKIVSNYAKTKLL